MCKRTGINSKLVLKDLLFSFNLDKDRTHGSTTGVSKGLDLTYSKINLSLTHQE